MADVVEIELKIHWETEKAYLLSDDGDKDTAEWVPKSKIEKVEEGEKGYALVTLPAWLASEKGWI